MPMNPAAPDKNRADQKSGGERPGHKEPKGQEDDETDRCDGRVLALQIGLRAFRDRPRDLLHFCRTGIGRQQF